MKADSYIVGEALVKIEPVFDRFSNGRTVIDVIAGYEITITNQDKSMTINVDDKDLNPLLNRKQLCEYQKNVYHEGSLININIAGALPAPHKRKVMGTT